MVLHFKCELVQPPYFIYMGEDKHENDELIRWGWPEDVWFHVDALSSAHVYLRLKEGETLDDVPTAVIQDCAQLVKENSIQVSSDFFSVHRNCFQILYHKTYEFFNGHCNFQIVLGTDSLSKARLFHISQKFRHYVPFSQSHS
ncbi:uncharacterized protein DC041_0010460 [Schistosoma bovis]|uniref:Coiled-coil domain-containing protein 25 n=1 Tax=Schistosoma bovis TaxID=6184 RepID=A0A430QLZ3_SCHBO|nr:uncharacterized protein DC041_0010460 [Schistosoma bovis]